MSKASVRSYLAAVDPRTLGRTPAMRLRVLGGTKEWYFNLVPKWRRA